MHLDYYHVKLSYKFNKYLTQKTIDLSIKINLPIVVIACSTFLLPLNPCDAHNEYIIHRKGYNCYWIVIFSLSSPSFDAQVLSELSLVYIKNSRFICYVKAVLEFHCNTTDRRIQSYHTIPFFANICAHLHLNISIYLFRALIVPTISACFQNCRPSLGTQQTEQPELHSLALLYPSLLLRLQSPSSVCFVLCLLLHNKTYLACLPPTTSQSSPASAARFVLAITKFVICARCAAGFLRKGSSL